MTSVKHYMSTKHDREEFQCDVFEKIFSNYSVIVSYKWFQYYVNRCENL